MTGEKQDVLIFGQAKEAGTGLFPLDHRGPGNGICALLCADGLGGGKGEGKQEIAYGKQGQYQQPPAQGQLLPGMLFGSLFHSGTSSQGMGMSRSKAVPYRS